MTAISWFWLVAFGLLVVGCMFSAPAKLAGALVKPHHCHRIVEQLVVMAASGCPRLAFYHHCVSRQFGVHLNSPISQ